MKISESVATDAPSVSFEVFPPKRHAEVSGTSTRVMSSAWHAQREQSAGRWRLQLLWWLYVALGKTALKLALVPVTACIFLFATPAKRALRRYYALLGVRHPPLFRHLLGFAWSLADKTDACTRRAHLPAMTVRDDADARAFQALVAAHRGAFLISAHLGTIEVLPALAAGEAPHVHAFQQLGHDALFTRLFLRHLDTSRLTLHAVEEIGVETAVRMQEAIARGELVLMAGDRVSAGSGQTLEHPFLGRPCAWPKGVFAFARLMDCPVFFVTCVRTGWNAYACHLRACAAPRAPLAETLAQYAAFLEEETRAFPTQWYQFYDFFAPPPRAPNRPRKRMCAKNGGIVAKKASTSETGSASQIAKA